MFVFNFHNDQLESTYTEITTVNGIFNVKRIIASKAGKD